MYLFKLFMHFLYLNIYFIEGLLTMFIKLGKNWGAQRGAHAMGFNF